jgi:hypothetical protein
MTVRNDMTARYDIDDRTVRFDYKTADGDPPKRINLDGLWWERRGFHPLSYDPETGLVWYGR